MSDQRLLRAVQRLASALTRLERQVAADVGVSVSQMRIVMSISQSGNPHKVTDLAEEQGLAVSTMTRNLKLLEERGWLHRASGDEDRRTIHVGLTEKGRELAAQLSDTHVSRFDKAFDRFHPSDRIERAVALDRVAAAIEKTEKSE
ncbi:MAG: hypothetical protein A2289_15440 [Deltaproteobacteria bacterium RIFOXYA12_FULL_58_15]|nr:MAG: hypothetical protein A2289_15440 [Deltaproteobacteria bacterium RIFOXYA12_FULL_58_15]